jgi:hypothetical protein
MKGIFCMATVALILYGTEGMLQAPFRMSLDARCGKSVFFSPVGEQVIINQVTMDKFLDDSNALYMSIDDFLDIKDKCTHDLRCWQFFIECSDLISRYVDYKNVLIRRIIPPFKKFAIEDAACEVAGLYDDAVVVDFVEYLKARLKSLQILAGE